MKKLIISTSIIAMLIMFWATTFVLVIQPIGMVPKGVTVWMFKPDRLFTSIHFIESADGLTLRTSGYINLLGRGIALIALGNSGDKIMRLPYSKTLYQISTNGIILEK